MKKLKRTLTLVICFYLFILSNLVYPSNNSEKEDTDWPLYFTGEVNIVDWKTKDEVKPIDDPTLFDDKLDHTQDHLDMLMVGGGNGKFLYSEDVARALRKIIKDAAVNTRSAFQGCESLKEIYDKRIRKIEKMPIVFNDQSGCGSNTGAVVVVNDGFLGNILRSIADQMAAGKGIDLDSSKYACSGDSLSKVIAHELIHIFTKSNFDSQVDECVVHCLTKKCIDKDHNIGDYTGGGKNLECNKISKGEWDSYISRTGVDPREFTGEGDCFCGSTWARLKWTATANCNEEEEKPDPDRGDTPDDNYSHFSGIYSMSSLLASMSAFPLNVDQEFFSFSYYPDVLIYDKFNYPDLPGLLDKFEGVSNIDDYEHESFSNNHRLLIIPSGEFMGDENSTIVKQALNRFVESGGTLLVLSQQYDTHIEKLVPVPEGETLKFYGWRQDQSCYNGSVYFKGMHPVLSSSTGELLSGAVDGYFEAWPSTSTVLLNRTKNREAAMLYYPYGNGTVILTTLYTDWGYAHSQATLMELRVVRDLITFAKNPQLPIPLYDLTENPIPLISLNVSVKNSAETPASKVKLKAFSPDRKKILHKMEQAVGLAPGEEVEIPVQFTLTGLGGTEYGIGHGD